MKLKSTNNKRDVFCNFFKVFLTAALFLFSVECGAADFSFRPSITVSEEYTDNVFLSSLTKQSDYITRVMPGFVMRYNAPFWDWDISYNYDYRYYAKRSRTDDQTHNANVRGLVRLIDEKLFLELNDTYSRISLDTSRTLASESLFVNQTDVNTATVSPYLSLRPTSNSTLRIGYRYINTLYSNSDAVDSISHVGFMDASYAASSNLSFNLEYSFTRQETVNLELNRHDAFLGPRYEYADRSFIFAMGGANHTDYGNGNLKTNPAWRAGITHTFDNTVATLSTDVRYTDTPQGSSLLTTLYSASITKPLPRGSVALNASYTKYSASDVVNPLPGATAVNDDRKNYSGGFTSRYELLDRLNGTIGLTYNYLINEQLNSITRQYLVNSGLDYTFGNDLIGSLTYNYTDSSSAQIIEDNRKVNRIILEFRKLF